MIEQFVDILEVQPIELECLEYHFSVVKLWDNSEALRATVVVDKIHLLVLGDFQVVEYALHELINPSLGLDLCDVVVAVVIPFDFDDVVLRF